MEKVTLEKWEAAAVELSCGYVIIQKPSINTRFCIGYGYGFTYEEASKIADAQRTNENMFIQKNLKSLKGEIERLEDVDNQIGVYPNYYGKEWRLDYYNHTDFIIRGWRLPTGATILNKEDRSLLIEAYKKVYAKFEKRLQTYLKRYGLSKLTVWTYDQNY